MGSGYLAESAPARPHASVRPAAGNIHVSRVTQSSFVAEAEKFVQRPLRIDGYKDFLISLSRDPGSQACRAFPSVGRPDAAARPGAAAGHGVVGWRTGSIARPKPAQGIPPRPDPIRLGAG